VQPGRRRYLFQAAHLFLLHYGEPAERLVTSNAYRIAALGVCIKMSSSDSLARRSDEVRPLYVSIEMAANFVYLARNSEIDSVQQQDYLKRALDILFEMRSHPDLSR
jgi:hypothetical protein